MVNIMRLRESCEESVGTYRFSGFGGSVFVCSIDGYLFALFVVMLGRSCCGRFRCAFR